MPAHEGAGCFCCWCVGSRRCWTFLFWLHDHVAFNCGYVLNVVVSQSSWCPDTDGKWDPGAGSWNTASPLGQKQPAVQGRWAPCILPCPAMWLSNLLWKSQPASLAFPTAQAIYHLTALPSTCMERVDWFSATEPWSGQSSGEAC